MEIQALVDMEIEVVESVDDDDNVESNMETISKGEILDVDVVPEEAWNDQRISAVQIQFGDGSVAFIKKDMFAEVEGPQNKSRLASPSM